MSKFSRLLAMYATMTKDDDSEASLMLAYWADQLQIAADVINAAVAH